ncbi:amino acid permease-like protein [Angomonas deanei]|uniref:Transmembrane amino acid transporter protein, putative n=1 Tax=Angomonas deanei TaxID=59799 RepID=A0A7G2CD00_9TRYP|nr:amino acid permease-like protein [Angomonas deanei]CAD2217700.1 Transmembrane amino acid transporter protein, putative [Angomonas deanei]|eukprot:EPY40458.1 amino acid permease-like protein [Angomonas deanei]
MVFCVKSGSVTGAALSLAVTTMGAGILTLPSAYSNAAVFPATILLFFVAYLTVVSVDFIVLAIEKLGLNSYEEITETLCGPVALEIIRYMLLVYNIGSAIGYLVVLGDVFEPLTYYTMNSPYFHALRTSKHILLLFWLVVVLPMTCVPTLGALHHTSFLAITATMFISFLIVFRYFVPNTVVEAEGVGALAPNNNSVPLWWHGKHPFLALPIIMFSFDCQSLVFQVYASLSVMTRYNMRKVAVLSLIVSGGIHAAVGLFGYLSNTDDVRENIISNYNPTTDRLFLVGYVFYAIPICLAYVLMLFPIRDSLFILWYGYSSASIATHVPRKEDYTAIVQQEEAVEREIQQYYERHPELDPPFGLTGVVLLDFYREAVRAKEAASETEQKDDEREKENDERNAVYKSYGATDEESGSPHSDQSYVQEEEREEQLEKLVEMKKQVNPYETISYRDHLLVTITLNIVCILGALLLPGIVSIVAFLGGLCSSSLCFTFPAIYRYQLHRNGLAPLRWVQEEGHRQPGWYVPPRGTTLAALPRQRQ